MKSKFQQIRNPISPLSPRGVLVLTAVLGLALSPMTEAVSPAPDGGYRNQNTAEGTNALFSLTSGIDNTALGFEALFRNTTGDFNTAGGFGALFNNISGTQNTATGVNALVSNNTGSFNTANGVNTLFRNTTGFQNAATGVQALFSNTTGFHNTADGFRALLSNTTGNHNTATGDSALESNTSGIFNTVDGAHSLTSNTTGSGNTVLGFNAGNSITTADNVIVIGENVAGANVSNSTFIGNILGATATGGVAVFIDSSGKLGTGTSSRRFKDDIEPMDKASDVLYSLKPVTFRYKKQIDPKGTSQFGLVAEDVEKVNPDLVVRDKEGRPYSVRYDAVNAMLLNEFLKEHKKVEGQQATIAELTSTLVQQQKHFQAASALQERKIQALAARVKEQGVQIQNVSAELQLNKPAPQTVLNNQ